MPKPKRVVKPCKHSGPERYIEWHEWAAKKAKTHRPVLCKKCGTWHIWEKKKNVRR